jgi:hypothetical protein
LAPQPQPDSLEFGVVQKSYFFDTKIDSQGMKKASLGLLALTGLS